MLDYINWLWPTIGLTTQELSTLFQTFQGDKDLNSPRKLSAETEREFILVEKKLQDAHVDHLDPQLDCIVVILPFTHLTTGILMQREDNILEWIFFCHKKQNEKLNTYVEKVSELILKGKLRLCPLTEIDPAETVAPFTNAEPSS